VIDQEVIADVRRELASAANSKNAPAMQAYMKSTMPYRGVNSPAQLRIWKAVFERRPLVDFDTWQDTALALWREATYREERYGAIALTGARQYRHFQTLATIPMYEEFVVNGAWWDYVDVIASRRIGALLERYPAAISRRMRGWSRARDMWKRRTAILSQLSRKEHTDALLLYECIEPNLADREFFIRKAIGWALRQYAWTNPDAVRSYVRAHAARLSPLSLREATKHLGGAPLRRTTAALGGGGQATQPGRQRRSR
jgi:3-methyladenine DNA glycosylase AlkD